MSFGGSVSAMLSSIKNNARAKRKTYFDRDNKYSKNGEEKRNPLLDKKATPEQLAEIRNSLIKENKKDLIKNLIMIVVVLVLIISLLLFFNN
jgi:hypothetical protein